MSIENIPPVNPKKRSSEPDYSTFFPLSRTAIKRAEKELTDPTKSVPDHTDSMFIENPTMYDFVIKTYQSQTIYHHRSYIHAAARMYTILSHNARLKHLPVPSIPADYGAIHEQNMELQSKPTLNELYRTMKEKVDADPDPMIHELFDMPDEESIKNEGIFYAYKGHFDVYYALKRTMDAKKLDKVLLDGEK